jgi:hypothetical protein
VLTCYAGQNIAETNAWAELESFMASHPKTLLAMPASRWEEWERSPKLVEVMRFWMLSREYVLLLRHPPESWENRE